MGLNQNTFGTTPEERAADIAADLDRRLRSIESGGPTARAYAAKDALITNNTNFIDMSDGPAVNVFVPDTASLVVEVMAEVVLGNNVGAVQLSQLILRMNDGTTTADYPLIAAVPGSGPQFKVTAQGDIAGTAPGGFNVIPRRELVRLGLAFGRVWSFALGYVGYASDGPHTFSERKLWVRVT